MSEPTETQVAQRATGRYRVVGGISTRERPDPTCNDWLEWQDGDVVDASEFPPHVDVAALIASGHLVAEEG